MNPKLMPIFARRSVREYTAQDIPDDMIRDLLEAAMAGPAAMAKDPWHFIISRAQQTRDHMADALPNGQMLRQAPIGLVVCGDLDQAHDCQLSYLLQDCSAAIQNLLLAASMLGLGACWLGVHPRQERISPIRELFALPDRILPVAAIALGWPDARPRPRTRFREAAVHRETWSG